MKRCSNCGKYPFCNKCESPNGYCEEFIRPPYTTKLIKVDGLNYTFEEVK